MSVTLTAYVVRAEDEHAAPAAGEPFEIWFKRDGAGLAGARQWAAQRSANGAPQVIADLVDRKAVGIVERYAGGRKA